MRQYPKENYRQVPDTILTANRFNPNTLILTAPLTSSDFETYRRQRPTGRAAGDEINVDELTYGSWNDGPPEMQLALYRAVSEIVTGRCAQPDWDGAVVNKLFQGKTAPILGCIVVDILIRWIEDSGGGIYDPVEYQQVS